MPKTLGIKLEGDVSLGVFAGVMQQFNALLRSLTAELSSIDAITWQIDDLRAGSAYTEVRGEAADEAEPERVIAAYGAVGQALQSGTVIPYTVSVGERANELLRVAADGAVELVRFYVAGNEVAAVAPLVGAERAATERPLYIGAVTGVVETLARRPSLYITVYDDLFDHAVKCALSANQYALAREVWGKRVVVSGRIVRDRETGRVTAVQDVLSVKIVERPAGDGRGARGALPWHPGDEPAEVTVRRLRDA